MTAFADDPMLRHICEQTDRLLSTIRELDDDALREGSRCPGWTRGHVLAHIARNADGFANVLQTAITGRLTPMYRSAEARDADIEAHAGGSASELEADVETSAERLLALLADVPEDELDLEVPSGRGPVTFRVGSVPWLRTREVVYHHVDLDAGFGFADVPDDLLRAGLHEAAERLTDAAPGLRVDCTFADGSTEQLLVGDAALPATGSAADVLAWLTGRSPGTGVSVDAPDRPTLPAWG